MKGILLAICICIFFVFSSQSQILYTDIIPDTTLITGTNTSELDLDINQDGTMDFKFWVGTYVDFCCTYYRSSISAIDTSSRIGMEPVSPMYCFPALMDSGEVIDNSLWWGLSTYINYNEYMYGCPGIIDSLKYYPVRLFYSGNYYFGWIRFFTTVVYPNPTGYTLITVHDMAINMTPNQPIVAGQILTGLNEGSVHNQLLTFPNPSGEFINILIPNRTNISWQLYLYNDLGGLIYQKRIMENDLAPKISLSDYPQGLYHLLLTNGVDKYCTGIIRM